MVGKNIHPLMRRRGHLNGRQYFFRGALCTIIDLIVLSFFIVKENALQ